MERMRVTKTVIPTIAGCSPMILETTASGVMKVPSTCTARIPRVCSSAASEAIPSGWNRCVAEGLRK